MGSASSPITVRARSNLSTADAMARFVIEVFTPGLDESGLAAVVDRVRAAAASLRRDGSPVRHLSSIFVPDDQTCFHIVEAPSPDAARVVSDDAGLTAPPSNAVIKVSLEQATLKEAKP